MRGRAVYQSSEFCSVKKKKCLYNVNSIMKDRKEVPTTSILIKEKSPGATEDRNCDEFCSALNY